MTSFLSARYAGHRLSATTGFTGVKTDIALTVPGLAMSISCKASVPPKNGMGTIKRW